MGIYFSFPHLGQFTIDNVPEAQYHDKGQRYNFGQSENILDLQDPSHTGTIDGAEKTC